MLVSITVGILHYGMSRVCTYLLLDQELYSKQDLAAQRAANREGALQLAALVESYGMEIVDAQQQQLATRACVAALWRSAPQRVINVSDDTDLLMGDYFDLAADLYGMPRPERIPRAGAEQRLSLMVLSFMGESRRLDNSRLKRELRLTLRYPTVREGLGAPKA